MFDHLNRLKQRDRGRDLSGLLVSIGVHLALLALLLYGADTTRRMVSEERASQPGTGQSGPGAPGGLGGAAPAGSSLDPDLRAALSAAVAPLSVRLPDTLALGRAEPIRLRIPPYRVRPDSVLSAPSGRGGAGRSLRLRPVRQATLYGSGFVVELQGASLQLAGPERPSEWQWLVTPTRPGPQTLALRVEAVVEVEGRERVVTLHTAQDEVVVHATAIQRLSRFFARHWTWLSALVGLMLWHWWRTVRDHRRYRAG